MNAKANDIAEEKLRKEDGAESIDQKTALHSRAIKKEEKCAGRQANAHKKHKMFNITISPPMGGGIPAFCGENPRISPKKGGAE